MSSNFLPRKQIQISKPIVPIQNQMKINAPPFIPPKRTTVPVPTTNN
jgi:hypothetical protein